MCGAVRHIVLCVWYCETYCVVFGAVRHIVLCVVVCWHISMSSIWLLYFGIIIILFITFDAEALKEHQLCCVLFTVYYDGDYRVNTVRQCAVESGALGCVERTGTYRFKSLYCHCSDDYCNGAMAVSVSLAMVSLVAVFTRLFTL